MVELGPNGPALFFLTSALVLAGLNVLYINYSKVAREVSIDYTDCVSEFVNATCSSLVTSPLNQSCDCEYVFYLKDNIPAPVYIYYSIQNFYQNHRSVIYSKDYTQLSGLLSNTTAPECQPYHEFVEQQADKKISRTVVPCGALANSMFFDTFVLYSANHSMRVPLIKRNLTWPSIKSKFANPKVQFVGQNLSSLFAPYAKPLLWKKNIWELDIVDPSNNGFLNEDFIIWMQPAATPNFRKLYRKVDHSHMYFKRGLQRGKYSLKIEYAFPVAAFKGRKEVIIANNSPFGGRNTFFSVFLMIMPAAYVVAAFLVLTVRIIKLRLAKRAAEKAMRKSRFGTMAPDVAATGEPILSSAFDTEEAAEDVDIEDEDTVVTVWDKLVNRGKQLIGAKDANRYHPQQSPHLTHVQTSRARFGGDTQGDCPSHSSHPSLKNEQ